MREFNRINYTRLHAVVEGHVQGVGFRYFVLTKAQHLNLTGWVRNTAEGNVEVMAEGERVDLDDLIELPCEKDRVRRLFPKCAKIGNPVGANFAFLTCALRID